MPPWLFRTLAGAVAAVVLVVGYLLASVTVPMMWADSVLDQMGGQPGNSVPLGMAYGFIFTFVPVLVGWQCRRRSFKKWARITVALAALLLTIPNILTLSVIYGGTQTAADARAKWAASANWFGTWSQIFMVVGITCAVAVIVLGRMWLRRGREVRELKAAQKLVQARTATKTPTAEAPPPAATTQPPVDP